LRLGPLRPIAWLVARAQASHPAASPVTPSGYGPAPGASPAGHPARRRPITPPLLVSPSAATRATQPPGRHPGQLSGPRRRSTPSHGPPPPRPLSRPAATSVNSAPSVAQPTGLAKTVWTRTRGRCERGWCQLSIAHGGRFPDQIFRKLGIKPMLVATLRTSCIRDWEGHGNGRQQ